MNHYLLASARVVEPGAQLFVHLLSNQLFLDLGTIIVEVYRLSGMRGFGGRASLLY